MDETEQMRRRWKHLESMARGRKIIDSMVLTEMLDIKFAQRYGASWVQIGDALGVSPQAAQQRWKRYVEAQADDPEGEG